MFSAKRILPVFLLVAAFCTAPQAQAQTSMPLYTTKYCVQVEWYFLAKRRVLLGDRVRNQ